MGIIDDIKRMQNEGRGEQDIAAQLQNRGYNPQEITDALAQTKIKDAVVDTESGESEAPALTINSTMQPSMLNPSTSEEPQSPELETQTIAPQSYPAEPYAQPYTSPASNQQGYGYTDQGYYAGPSADAITEIVEQIVAEKVERLHQEVTRSTESRKAMETKLEYIDERLKKIERVIDRLQLSILQKVGEYMTNVEDLKTEVVETQKSFKALLASSNSHMQARQKESE